MVSDEEHFDPSESILKDSLNTIKSEMDLPKCMFKCETIIELKGKPVKIPVLGKGELGEILFRGGFNWLSTFYMYGIMYLR